MLTHSLVYPGFLLQRPLFFLIILAIFAGAPLIPSTASAQEISADSLRLVYFDVAVNEALAGVYGQRQVLTQAMAGELSRLPGLTIVDRDTPENLVQQRKLGLENCIQPECRFALVNALPSVELMLEATLEPFGEDCVFNIQIKNVRTGTVASTGFGSSPCTPREILQSVKTVTAGIWPPYGRRAPSERTTVVPVPQKQGRPGSNLYLPSPESEVSQAPLNPQIGNESSSPRLGPIVSRWGGLTAMVVGGLVLSSGWSQAKQGSKAYDEKGQSLAHYDDAIGDVKQGNRYQTVGGVLMAIGASGFGLSFVLE